MLENEIQNTETAEEVVKRKVPRWYLLYFALAFFDIMAVTFSLSLNHQLMGVFTDSVRVDQRWTMRLADYAEINSLAQSASAPANAVFDSRNVPLESARLETELMIFHEKMVLARRDLADHVEEKYRKDLMVDLDDIDHAMNAMVVEARAIFQHFSEGKSLEAGKRMAAMDRKHTRVTRAISKMGRRVHRIQGQLFSTQLSEAESLKSYEFVVGILILVMVGAVAVYGHKMQKAMNETYMKSLEDSEEITKSKIELERALRFKSDFLANMSHEIRTPMTAILGFADQLKGEEYEDPTVNLCVNTIHRNGKHLMCIINDILDLSKLEAGKVELERTLFDLVDLIDEVVVLQYIQASGKSVELYLDYKTEIPSVILGDSTRLRQVLLNLLSNAIKFTTEGSVGLEISFNNEEAVGEDLGLCIDVKDTGCGISDMELKTLFDSFSQADISTTRKYGGTGLGLTISRHYVELMGGRIFVKETVLDEGTCFRIILPVSEIAHVKMNDLRGKRIVNAGFVMASETSRLLKEDDEGVVSDIRLDGLRVLFAEDTVDNQVLVRGILEGLGATVMIVGNGEELIDLYQTNKGTTNAYDVIIVDMQMPIMDGYTAVSKMRDFGEEVVIIALSATVTEEGVIKIKEVGCTDFVGKPLEEDSLIVCLNRYREEITNFGAKLRKELKARAA